MVFTVDQLFIIQDYVKKTGSRVFLLHNIREDADPAKKELQFNCSLTIVSITRVIWPQNYSFFSSNNCSFSSIKNAVLLPSLLNNFE